MVWNRKSHIQLDSIPLLEKNIKIKTIFEWVKKRGNENVNETLISGSYKNGRLPPEAGLYNNCYLTMHPSCKSYNIPQLCIHAIILILFQKLLNNMSEFNSFEIKYSTLKVAPAIVQINLVLKY